MPIALRRAFPDRTAAHSASSLGVGPIANFSHLPVANRTQLSEEMLEALR